jgi:hypothetical protein
MAYNKSFSWILYVYLFSLLLGTTACFEGQEGCLDARALNFQVTADTDCSGCCTYPDLELIFTHKVYLPDDTLNLEYGQAYPNDLGQYFALEQISYYLSEVKLLDRFGDPIEVEDRIDIPFAQGGDTTFVERVDNFTVVRPEVFSTREIGTLIYEGDISAVQFTLGIPEFVQDANPAFFEEDHPLAAQEPAMFDANLDRFLHHRISLFRDTLPETAAEVIQITDEEDLITLTLPLGVSSPGGFNTVIRLEVDYLSWFEGIDLQNSDQESIKEQIVANLANSFRILAVDFSR